MNVREDESLKEFTGLVNSALIGYLTGMSGLFFLPTSIRKVFRGNDGFSNLEATCAQSKINPIPSRIGSALGGLTCVLFAGYRAYNGHLSEGTLLLYGITNSASLLHEILPLKDSSNNKDPPHRYV